MTYSYAGRQLREQRLRSAELADEIQRYIASTDLQVGDRIPSERELAQRYSASRSVVRHAIAVLQQRGLLESRPGSGVFVRDGAQVAIADAIDAQLRRDAVSLVEVIEVRTIIEVQNAAFAAQRFEPGELAPADAAIARMKTATNPEAFVVADIAYHESLGVASHNRVATTVLSGLRSLLFDSMLIGTSIAGAREAAIEEHALILSAVYDRNAEQARELMSSHMSRAYDELLAASFPPVTSSSSPTRHRPPLPTQPGDQHEDYK